MLPVELAASSTKPVVVVVVVVLIVEKSDTLVYDSLTIATRVLPY